MIADARADDFSLVPGANGVAYIDLGSVTEIRTILLLAGNNEDNDGVMYKIGTTSVFTDPNNIDVTNSDLASNVVDLT